jgi:hypothetical protein
MRKGKRFNYTPVVNAFGEIVLKPDLPLSLAYHGRATDTTGLLDFGAEVNVLPYRLGIELGAVWTPGLATIRLSGNLARFPACPLITDATVGKLPEVKLAFAWIQTDNVPLILGQINFFMEFDVCFYRSREMFEISPKL